MSDEPAMAGQPAGPPPDLSLDLKGLKCPLPVLKARRAVKDMAAGSLLEVLADDPAAVLDFAHFCEVGGHALEESSSREEGGPAPVLRFLIRAYSGDGGKA